MNGKTVQLNSLTVGACDTGETTTATVMSEVGDFMAVVDRFQGPLLRYVGQMIGGGIGAEAEDIVQEAFLRLHRQITKHGADSVQHLSTWLYRVTHNLTLDQLRKQKRKKDREEAKPLEPHVAESQLAEEMDALSEVLRQEARQVALQALAQLDHEHRQVVLLKIIQGMSLREVAEVVGVSLSTINYRLNQGLKELARRLKNAGVV